MNGFKNVGLPASVLVTYNLVVLHAARRIWFPTLNHIMSLFAFSPPFKFTVTHVVIMVHKALHELAAAFLSGFISCLTSSPLSHACLFLFIGFLGLSGAKSLLLLTLGATVLSLQIFTGLAPSSHHGPSLCVTSSNAFSTALPTLTPPHPSTPIIVTFLQAL